jgi:exopolyphosphatase/guanosine-5'-triphosphate,3'-diphosphate pyrophosphatase
VSTRPRVAAIDIGTNSVLLLVAERDGSGTVRAVRERATITRLGEGVDRTGEISEVARERTLACLRAYADDLRELGVTRVAAVGTSAMRDARGGPAFADAAGEVLGSRPTIASGDEEARLTFAGSLAGLSLDGPVAVFDVGGGSTEIVVGERTASGPRIDAKVSLDVGSVRLTERHVRSDPPTLAELEAVARDVDSALAGVGKIPMGATLVGVAGTVTTLAAVARDVHPYDGARVHGASISASEIAAVRARLAALTLAERRALPTVDAKRADVIVAGAVIVDRVIAWSGASSLLASDRGVRWGLALDLLSSLQALPRPSR